MLIEMFSKESKVIMTLLALIIETMGMGIFFEMALSEYSISTTLLEITTVFMLTFVAVVIRIDTKGDL